MSDKFWPALKEAVKEFIVGRYLLDHIRAEKKQKEASEKFIKALNDDMLKEMERKIRSGRL